MQGHHKPRDVPVDGLVPVPFGAEYTLAGVDLMLHRIGGSVQFPSRQAADRDDPPSPARPVK
jgi:hypothetical protein